jgi:nucleoid DNA-binding protein
MFAPPQILDETNREFFDRPFAARKARNTSTFDRRLEDDAIESILEPTGGEAGLETDFGAGLRNEDDGRFKSEEVDRRNKDMIPTWEKMETEPTLQESIAELRRTEERDTRIAARPYLRRRDFTSFDHEIPDVTRGRSSVQRQADTDRDLKTFLQNTEERNMDTARLEGVYGQQIADREKPTLNDRPDTQLVNKEKVGMVSAFAGGSAKVLRPTPFTMPRASAFANQPNIGLVRQMRPMVASEVQQAATKVYDVVLADPRARLLVTSQSRENQEIVARFLVEKTVEVDKLRRFCANDPHLRRAIQFADTRGLGSSVMSTAYKTLPMYLKGLQGTTHADVEKLGKMNEEKIGVMQTLARLNRLDRNIETFLHPIEDVIGKTETTKRLAIMRLTARQQRPSELHNYKSENIMTTQENRASHFAAGKTMHPLQHHKAENIMTAPENRASHFAAGKTMHPSQHPKAENIMTTQENRASYFVAGKTMHPSQDPIPSNMSEVQMKDARRLAIGRLRHADSSARPPELHTLSPQTNILTIASRKLIASVNVDRLSADQLKNMETRIPTTKQQVALQPASIANPERFENDDPIPIQTTVTTTRVETRLAERQSSWEGAEGKGPTCLTMPMVRASAGKVLSEKIINIHVPDDPLVPVTNSQAVPSHTSVPKVIIAECARDISQQTTSLRVLRHHIPETAVAQRATAYMRKDDPNRLMEERINSGAHVINKHDPRATAERMPQTKNQEPTTGLHIGFPDARKTRSFAAEDMVTVSNLREEENF